MHHYSVQSSLDDEIVKQVGNLFWVGLGILYFSSLCQNGMAGFAVYDVPMQEHAFSNSQNVRLPLKPRQTDRKSIQLRNKARMSIVIAEQIVEKTLWIRTDQRLQPGNTTASRSDQHRFVVDDTELERPCCLYGAGGCERLLQRTADGDGER